MTPGWPCIDAGSRLSAEKDLCFSLCLPYKSRSMRHDLDTGYVAGPTLAQDLSAAGAMFHTSSHREACMLPDSGVAGQHAASVQTCSLLLQA